MTTPKLVVCMKWGTKYEPEYVRNLHAMVHRSMRGNYRFTCLTDRPEGLDCDTIALPGNLEGWWNKVYLFKPGLFEGPVLFLDLDVVVTGLLTPFFQGGIINDWNLPGYNSSVMSWTAGEHSDIWEKFTEDVPKRLRGDQDWITELGRWETFPEGMCVSYRKHAVECVPQGAIVVCMHGRPKPDEITEGWVPQFWKENGLAQATFESTQNALPRLSTWKTSPSS